MLNRIIDSVLAYRWLVLGAVVTLVAVGGYALYTIPVEGGDEKRLAIDDQSRDRLRTLFNLCPCSDTM